MAEIFMMVRGLAGIAVRLPRSWYNSGMLRRRTSTRLVEVKTAAGDPFTLLELQIEQEVLGSDGQTRWTPEGPPELRELSGTPLQFVSGNTFRTSNGTEVQV